MGRRAVLVRMGAIGLSFPSLRTLVSKWNRNTAVALLIPAEQLGECLSLSLIQPTIGADAFFSLTGMKTTQ